MVYRVVNPGDNPNKGLFKGACNIAACQSTHEVEYYNFGTGSYYCRSCAQRINEANDYKTRDGRLGVHPLCQLLTPEEACAKDTVYAQKPEQLRAVK